MKTTLLVLMMAGILSGRAAADSIGTTYNMDRMLSEPHPLANEYGTRWQKPQPAPATPGTLYIPATPARTIQPTAPAVQPSIPTIPGQAPEPPPTTFAPPLPPPVTASAPPAPPPAPTPKSAPAKPAVVTEAPVPVVMEPQLSIDASGVDLEPEKPEPQKAEPAMMQNPGNKEFAQPGPLPSLPPQ
ncbi:MAG: hypothetical protein O3A85_08680 [Proteobacteria bacterium]|nr:hypothetical protein [Pseudomonadota bacterium]